MVAHDPVAHREAQPGAGRLGREERVEDARQRVLRDARAVIGHLHDEMAAAVFGRGDADRPVIAERLAGIRNEVQDHLLQRVRVAQHG